MPDRCPLTMPPELFFFSLRRRLSSWFAMFMPSISSPHGIRLVLVSDHHLMPCKVVNLHIAIYEQERKMKREIPRNRD